MARLTLPHYGGDGHYMKCSESFGCDGNCGECDELDKIVDRLAYYEDMEEQGRLVVLPCKVGTPIYYIRKTKHGFRYVNSDDFRLCNVEWFTQYFGKTVFLDRESAENALKGGAN